MPSPDQMTAQATQETAALLRPTAPTPPADAKPTDDQAAIQALDQMAEKEWAQAQRDNRVHSFVSDVMKARNVEEPVYTPPPPAAAILKRTQEEMEAGKRAVEARAVEDAKRPKHRPDPTETHMVPVFRPRDFVPDPKRNTGHVKASTLASE